MLCQDCPQRDTCKKLCDAARKYANQDYTGRRESYLPEGDVSEVFENEAKKEWPERTYPDKQQVILLYFVDHRKTAEIADMVGYSRQHIRRIIAEALKKLGI